MKKLTEELKSLCEVKNDPLRSVPTALILSFVNDKIVTTIRIVILDFDSGLHLEITNMTTLPYSETGKGYGTIALKKLLSCVEKYNMKSITAVQVQSCSKTFWVKNGFIDKNNHTSDYAFKQA